MKGFHDLSNLTAAEYKMYHESLMLDNHGSSAIHTFFSILSTVLCTILACIVPKKNSIIQYVYEYSVLVLPLIMIHTIIPNFIFYFNYIMLTILISFVTHFKKHNPFVIRKVPDNRLQSITCLRALTYLITVFCILAVDFNDFPRYLAKTEKYGYSLMDTGVGLFVLMSGLVHKDINRDNFYDIIKGNIKFIVLLIVLGVMRFISIEKLNYQVHITEYGIHWNFFFTLAVCKLLSNIALFCFNHACILSFSTLILHELILYNGLQDWVFRLSPRDNMITANKEGISSCLGYVSLYFFAAYLKKLLCNYNFSDYKNQVLLVIGSLSLWALSFAVHAYRPTSRTLANAGYCIYLESILVTILMILLFFEISYDHKLLFETPYILSDINSNGLLYFLAANLITGAINLSMRTFLQSSLVTFVTLNVYMIANICFTVYLRTYGLRI